MGWTTILASQTDADSPLNQVLFDALRENLDYLKAQTDTLAYLHLGGYNGSTSGAGGTVLDLGGPFNLAAPPAGKKWRLHLRCQASKSLGTPVLRFKLYDKTDAQLSYVDSATLTASMADYDLYLDVTTAQWGRLVVHFLGASSSTTFRNGAVRAYLVNA